MPRVLPKEQLPVAGGQLPVAQKKRHPRSSLATGNSQLATSSLGRLQFVIPKQKKRAGDTPTPRKKQKNDPRLVAAARELRDRWLEKVNDDPSVLLSNGKYEVSKMALEAPTSAIKPTPLLEAA